MGVNKDVHEAAIDAFASASQNKMFGRFNKALEKAFKDNGLKGDKLSRALGEVIKSQVEFLKGIIKTGISEQGKERRKNDKKVD